MNEYENFVIRNAVLEDLPFIVEIYNSTIPGRMVTADLEPVTVESKEKWFYDHSYEKRPFFVVENSNKICGWLSFQSFYGRPAYNTTVEISIYVHEEFRKRGIGRLLMEKAISECPRLGIKTLLGFVFGHNKPSLNLFYSYGFKKWGDFPNVALLDGVERDLLILGKRVCD